MTKKYYSVMKVGKRGDLTLVKKFYSESDAQRFISEQATDHEIERYRNICNEQAYKVCPHEGEETLTYVIRLQ